jgi:transcriptional regulator with XRE-family HTH domain
MVRLRVREIAQEKRLTISELSRRAGLNIGTVRRVWNDPHHDVSMHVLEKLAGALEVRLTALIDDTPDVPIP